MAAHSLFEQKRNVAAPLVLTLQYIREEEKNHKNDPASFSYIILHDTVKKKVTVPVPAVADIRLDILIYLSQTFSAFCKVRLFRGGSGKGDFIVPRQGAALVLACPCLC